MKIFSNLTRQERIQKIMEQRRQDVALVLENLTEANNISAILRTAEGFGIGKIYVIYEKGDKPHLSKNTSKGASKWLDVEYFTSTKECLGGLKKDGYKLVGALVDPSSKQIWEADMGGKIAVVVGNEANGLSKEAQEEADENVYIPMFGLTESFNVSVSAGIFVYEVIRQKEDVV